MADKTYAQLTAATSIAPGDLLASYSGVSGPLKSISWSLVVSTLQTALGLGGAATRNVGQASGTVAAGDDPRFAAVSAAAANAQATANAALPAAQITSGTVAPGTLGPGQLYFQYTP